MILIIITMIIIVKTIIIIIDNNDNNNNDNNNDNNNINSNKDINDTATIVAVSLGAGAFSLHLLQRKCANTAITNATLFSAYFHYFICILCILCSCFSFRICYSLFLYAANQPSPLTLRTLSPDNAGTQLQILIVKRFILYICINIFVIDLTFTERKCTSLSLPSQVRLT